MRGRYRHFTMGLATLLGRRRGFFIPYRYATDPPAGADLSAFAPAAANFAVCEPAFAEILDALDRHRAAFAQFSGAVSPAPPVSPAPRWDQDWFPRLDGAVAYEMVARLAPRQIVEVGSGHSTRFLARAIADFGLGARLTAIDPAPRATIATLPVNWYPTSLQQADAGLFSELAAGDIAFFDSSHILMPGTDVDLILNRILPALAPGVVVHFHDIFLPDAYPPDWNWRGYNEQNAVAHLVHGTEYETLFSSHYAATRMRVQVDRSVMGSVQMPPGAHESSLWLRRL